MNLHISNRPEMKGIEKQVEEKECALLVVFLMFDSHKNNTLLRKM
jgi:hypothetical protein